LNRHWRPNSFLPSQKGKTVHLELSFDFAQDIWKKADRGEPVEPRAQHERLINSIGLAEILEEYVFSRMDSLVTPDGVLIRYLDASVRSLHQNFS
jgi:hypothetical protein